MKVERNGMKMERKGIIRNQSGKMTGNDWDNLRKKYPRCVEHRGYCFFLYVYLIN